MSEELAEFRVWLNVDGLPLEAIQHILRMMENVACDHPPTDPERTCRLRGSDVRSMAFTDENEFQGHIRLPKA